MTKVNDMDLSATRIRNASYSILNSASPQWLCWHDRAVAGTVANVGSTLWDSMEDLEAMTCDVLDACNAITMCEGDYL